MSLCRHRLSLAHLDLHRERLHGKECEGGAPRGAVARVGSQEGKLTAAAAPAAAAAATAAHAGNAWNRCGASDLWLRFVFSIAVPVFRSGLRCSEPAYHC